MSRIHEALKQAKRGQEPNPLSELGAQPEAVSIPTATAPPIENTSEWMNLNLLPPPTPQTEAPIAFADGFGELRERCVKRNWKFDYGYSVFSGKKPSVQLTEQFRKLRSRLYEVRKNQPLQTLLVTSTVPAEGKTFVALNLALAITRQHGRRVLLVDGDLRMPKLASCLGVPQTPGLTEFLRGNADESAIVQSDPEGSLFFIAGGSMVANPTEMLASEKLQWLINRMAPLFDWIIVDAPPVLPVSDAGVLAGHCDGVVMVVRAGSTGYDAVGAALKELRGKRLLGVVLNRAEQREGFYDGGSYYAGTHPLPA